MQLKPTNCIIPVIKLNIIDEACIYACCSEPVWATEDVRVLGGSHLPGHALLGRLGARHVQV